MIPLPLLLMPYLFQHYGVAVGALTGVLAGAGKKVDLFGVIVLALVASMGGGTLRDLLLGIRPVFWVRDTSLVYTALAVAVIAFLVARVWNFGGRGLLIADAVSLALFSIAGVQIAAQQNVAVIVVIAMGVITGVVGGMLRDVIAGEIPLVFRQESPLYATAALCGCIFYVAAERLHPLPEGIRTWLSVSVILALRFGAMAWKWTLPAFRIKSAQGA